MNKKTIIIIVVSLAVIGGVYYGFNRWRQQRLANQILKGVYGINTSILGKLTGGGSIQEQMAKEAAKEEAQQKANEAKEAAKTPEDKYNETEEVATYDANSKATVNEIKSILDKVFGKTKLTSVAADVYGSTAISTMDFEIARLATGDDLNALNKALTDKGWPIVRSMIDNKSAVIMAGNDETGVYAFSFEIGGQTIGTSITKTSQ